ncbi:MAG: LysE family translocator [Proteobacteria bacterium]|nr:LysE family translocator [Pseudomonadota bacterium]MBS0492866.1 LysE family translocator [Pseudomonadota bacterium]
MFTLQELLIVALTALALALVPGPNMVYCVSRSLTQGQSAGLSSLVGVALGYGVHLLAATLGLTTLLVTVPGAFDALRCAGAAYLLWIAWQALRPAGGAAFDARALARDRPGRLVRMGFLTCLLNPMVAVFYLSLLPQFLHPERGTPLLQCITLGAVQISTGAVTHTLLVLCAARVAQVLGDHRGWVQAQHYVMATVLGLLSLRLLLALGHGVA